MRTTSTPTATALNAELMSLTVDAYDLYEGESRFWCEIARKASRVLSAYTAPVLAKDLAALIVCVREVAAMDDEGHTPRFVAHLHHIADVAEKLAAVSA